MLTVGFIGLFMLFYVMLLRILDILRYRAWEAFHKGVVSDEILEFIAQLSSDRRDARYAIDLLWRSGKFAELDGSDIVTA